MLWKTQHCSKCHFTSALCSVSRWSLQCNNYTAKKMQESVCRACNSKYRVLVNEDEMKSSVYMMALILRLKGIIRVDPCHPIWPTKYCTWGAWNLYLGEVRNHIRRYQLEHNSIPSVSLPLIYVSLIIILSLIFFQLEIMQLTVFLNQLSYIFLLWMQLVHAFIPAP